VRGETSALLPPGATHLPKLCELLELVERVADGVGGLRDAAGDAFGCQPPKQVAHRIVGVG